MIIVTQNKEQIINFDNTQTLGLEEFDKTKIMIENLFELGEYQTEERAKEVLQEIIQTCTKWEIFKYGIAEGIGTPKYEMPKEWLWIIYH